MPSRRYSTDENRSPGDVAQGENRSHAEGILFITFLSLILRMHLLKGLLLELAKIKKIRLANGEVITTEISKRQRTILETLGVCA